MSAITFVTGSSLKFRNATHACEAAGIKLIQRDLAIDEIQGENSERITRRKCQDAFNIIGSEMLVNDDTWEVPSLGGFPGPYLKSINQWFTADDWIRLAEPLTDRTVILTQYTVFQNATVQKLFTYQIKGQLLREPRGQSASDPFQEVVSLDVDNGLSMAETLTGGRRRDASKIWQEFAAWYNQSISNNS